MNSQSFKEDELWEIEGTYLRKEIIMDYSDAPSEQFQANIPYNSQTRELDLGKVLHDHLTEKQIPNSYRYQIFHYSNSSEYFVFGGMYPFQDFLLLGEEYISEQYIFVKVNRVHPPMVSTVAPSDKKKRKHDRTIQQILRLVSQWRKIQSQENVTLQQSAKYLNISKKTLDDYFFQIKQGQTNGFDFELHLNDKIGVLRKFVREHHSKQESSQKFQLLQKFLNNEFDSDEKEDQQHEFPQSAEQE